MENLILSKSMRRLANGSAEDPLFSSINRRTGGLDVNDKDS